MLYRKNNNYLKICFFITFLFITLDIFARAGGGGGDGFSGGDGDSGIIEFVIYLLYSLPFPYNIIVLGIFILLLFIFRKKIQQKSVLNKIPDHKKMRNDAAILNIRQNDISFNLDKFIKKVEIAFMEIQNAWMAQDLKKIRKFISDGVYRRYDIQIKMMKELQQENILSNIKINSINIVDYRPDGKFDVIDVAIHADMKDKFISNKIKKLNSGGYESFIEYWTFIKKAEFQNKDIYSNPNCPQCGALIIEIEGETGICPYCKSVINSGDFDWILCEITQADDYTFSKSLSYKQANLNNKIQSLFVNDEYFSIQQIEDKAANALLQYEIALALQNPAIARRFLTNTAFDDLLEKVKNRNKVLFNRLYLNDVSIISHWKKEKMNYIGIFAKKSFQRVEVNIEDNKENYTVIDPVVSSQSVIVVMCRNSDAKNPKGLLYVHQCPNCGGTLSDTIDINCPYCNAEVNSPDFEWIVDGVYSVEQYKQIFEDNEPDELLAFGVNKADDLLDVRDYAFNNTLIMFAIDGVFDNEERQFAVALAKKLGYNTDKIQSAIDLAMNKKLVLRMPENVKKQNKIIKLMEKAASANNNITAKESELLNYVRSNFGSIR